MAIFQLQYGGMAAGNAAGGDYPSKLEQISVCSIDKRNAPFAPHWSIHQNPVNAGSAS
jgi:hypothetical protein